ncbi:gamma-glutamyltransferase [Kineococcus sp. SYSU DK003]|uniref:gamma-glutamyltransferase n=1 Tax=Kineococcus sp. SYSU DK003 TaxID=3383124 RepID=UPI003D7E0F74
MRTVAVAAPHPAGVELAQEAVRAGGNALDAALAAAAALTVVYPHQCALGGDLIALVRDERSGREPRTTAVVSAGTLPAGLDLDALAGAPMPRRGPATVTVPGVVAGWTALARLGAELPLPQVFSRAAELAEAGLPVSAGLARALRDQEAAVLADPGLRAVFAPTGAVLGEGDPVAQPALAATLRRLAEDPQDLYRGRTADLLAAGLRALGGTHTGKDLRAHVAEVLPALHAEVDGAHWYVAPPPSQGALLLGVAEAAVAAERSGRPDDLVVASLRGMDVRDRELGDPRTGEVDVTAMTTLSVRTGAAAPAAGRALGDTVAVTAVDDEGLSVSLIQSVFQTFGAGILEPATGIVLHNRGAGFSTDPASPARVRHGSRPPHTLCPVIVDTGEAVLAAGCQGGRAQPWILGQTLPALLAAADGTELQDVLARPRWVVGARDLGHERVTLVTEPGAETAAPAAQDAGAGVVHRDCLLDEAGHVQIAVRSRRSGLLAATDPRADGRACVTTREPAHEPETL